MSGVDTAEAGEKEEGWVNAVPTEGALAGGRVQWSQNKRQRKMRGFPESGLDFHVFLTPAGTSEFPGKMPITWPTHPGEEW